MNAEFNWPPPYTVRHSARAKAVSLHICPRRGLEVIAPLKFKPEKSMEVLERHRDWIEKTWRRIQPQLTNESGDPPRELALLALNEKWNVQYFLQGGGDVRLEVCDSLQLIMRGNITHVRRIKLALSEWLKKQARMHLVPLLEQLSSQYGFSYSAVRIGAATTRWGSCSEKKLIRLNYKLLFLPPDLVDYVLLHELCHTVHLNHSRHFWELLRSVYPDCHPARRRLKAVVMPLWLE